MRKNEAEEDFVSLGKLRDYHRQHFGVSYVAYGAQDTKNKVSISTVISRKHLLAGELMRANIVATALHSADFMVNPNYEKCPRFRDLKAGALADSSKPYKGMMAALESAREQARDLKKRHSRVDEYANGVLRMVSDTRIAGRRSIIFSGTDWYWDRGNHT